MQRLEVSGAVRLICKSLGVRGLIGIHSISEQLKVVFTYCNITMHYILVPPSAAVTEELSYTSTHPPGHTGPVTGSLYLFFTIS